MANEPPTQPTVSVSNIADGDSLLYTSVIGPANELPTPFDEKNAPNGHLADIEGTTIQAFEIENDAELPMYDEHGREKVLETAADFAAGLCSLDDDPTMPVFTFRLCFVGIGLSIFGSVLGMLFILRPQTISVSALFLQLLAYMIGKLLEIVIPGPGSRYNNGNRFWRFMNPGPFNLKEHVAAQIMSNTASGVASACAVFASDELFYGINVNAGDAIFTILASQLIGYGFAGMFRSMLVYPTVMLWPQNMIYVNLFDAMHRGKGEIMQRKRLKVFWLIVLGVFVYEWFPEYIAPLFGSVSIACLSARHSPWVTNIFGGAEGNEGLGFLAFGLDWVNITSQPFYLPLATQVSLYVGWAMNYWLLPVVYASNLWNAKNFPFISQNLFFKNGTIYDQTLILTSELALNRTALEIVGQPWLSSSRVIFNFGMSLYAGATIVHILIWHGKEIWSSFRDSVKGVPIDDPHYKKMLVYEEVPMWWYVALTVGAFITAVACAYTERSHLPWWALLLALACGLVWMPFYGAMAAITSYVNFSPAAQLFQMLASAVIPGSSQANMYFELYSGQALAQGVTMLGDLKLGQYTKLPPRATFSVQIAGTVIGALLNYVVMQVVIDNERAVLLSNEGSRIWSGQQVQAFNANAVLWGALGKEIYSPHGSYFIVPLGIIIGLFLPVFPYLLWRRYGWEWLRHFNTAVFAASIGGLASGANGYIMTAMSIGLFSHFYLRKYHAGFFRRYNYLFGAAIDGGAQIFVFIFSFTVGGASGLQVPFPNWALNPKGNADYCMTTQR